MSSPASISPKTASCSEASGSMVGNHACIAPAAAYRDPEADGFLTLLGKSIKSLGKLLLKSHRICFLATEPKERPIVILGNGPSLNQAIPHLTSAEAAPHDSMAVNFAANAPEFNLLQPEYYLLADPHFFNNTTDPNVSRLIANLQQVGWPMTLFLPFEAKKKCTLRPTENLKIEYYNALGIEGFGPLTRAVYRSGRGMPRPRNVLIPAIMTAISLGYRTIYLAGADHSWTRTLSVDDDNAVVSVQPHFYNEDERETARIRKDYLNYPLHHILRSFFHAFRAYHTIAQFARRQQVEIINSTPGSFIDAFRRAPLP